MNTSLEGVGEGRKRERGRTLCTYTVVKNKAVLYNTMGRP